MKQSEFLNILVAIVILTLTAGFSLALAGKWNGIAQIFLFSTIIVLISIFAKKIMAYLLDSDVEHEIWKVSRWGWKPQQYFKKAVPAGVIFPLFFSLISSGLLKFIPLLTYETRALKRRAAKRFGFYSFTEITENHNAIIGAAGIIAVLMLTIITYFLPANFEYLAKISAYYAFCNLLPISKLDGAQIFFGSRVLWTTLALISTIFLIYALIL